MPVQNRLTSSREFWVWTLGGLFSLLLLYATRWNWPHVTPIEAFAFITGAANVYLTVRESIWNFPVGLINNVFFFVLFFRGRIYADMSLQVVYFVLGVLGWIWWARGTGKDSELPVGRTDFATWVVLFLLVVAGTAVMCRHLISVNDAAPFWDAFTTCLSLAAQYLLSRKWLENWYLWMLADVIYVPLYCSRELWLTGGLYFGFLCLCVMGWWEWRRTMKMQSVQQALDNAYKQA